MVVDVLLDLLFGFSDVAAGSWVGDELEIHGFTLLLRFVEVLADWALLAGVGAWVVMEAVWTMTALLGVHVE